jgi:DNA-directed RNA polymerase specialized sigma24 family protein
MSIHRDQARAILTPKQFDAWDLHERGLSIRATAAALHISTTTVRDRIFAARQHIARHQEAA